MSHLAHAYLMAATVSLIAAYLGALLFGSGVVAPLVIRVLGEQAGGPLLRAYWPRYHAFAAITGAVLIGLTAFALLDSDLPSSFVTLVVALATLMTVFFTIGWRLIPAINLARDEGRQEAFAKLHRLDVMLVGLGMLLAGAILTALIYVLPAQLTY